MCVRRTGLLIGIDAGLSVLSLAAGPVLGAFLTGVLTRRVDARAILIGMGVGSAVVGWAWWTEATAWTWFAFLGASVTAAVAAAIGTLTPRPAHG